MNEILRFANVVGALATKKKGAIDSLPSLEEVNNLL
jgi:sugar/nucleoside kinase (ribokinase family)